MKITNRQVSICLILLSFLFQGSLWAATSLNKKQLDTIYDATYEVVMKKLEHDPLSYEKPLPMNLIPYKVRTDKYWSIGTAFAIGPNKYVSAAHVFGLETTSQYDDFYLRDRHGNVYSIDSVTEYAGNRDFIVFTLKQHQARAMLEVNESPVLNTKVYAVGNAQGDGVVLRDGLYTSNTPEEVDGAWSWIRFSAAASPGNSGGPLLDAQGRVIGIVLRKSENENLNYALPIREVLQAPKNMAVHDMPLGYTLENMDYQKNSRFKYTQKLPMRVHDLNVSLAGHLNDFSTKLLDQLLKENQDSIFPNGKGSKILLHKTYYATFPNIIWKRNDGNWIPFEPNEVNRADLGHNGMLSYGNMKNTTLFHLEKPDNISYQDFIHDGKMMMDDFLKGVNVSRTIGSEKIRITSLGKPANEFNYKDQYGRVWIVRRWLIGYDDTGVIAMTLPTPDGSITMLRHDSTGRIDAHLLDLKALSNFVYLTYYGTVKEWQDFLAMKTLIPAPLHDIRLDYSISGHLQFSSNNVRFNYDKSLMDITDDSDLTLYLSYYKKDDKVTWDIARVMIGENKNNNTYFLVSRTAHPDKDMNDSSKADWARLVNRKFPFNKVSFFKDKNTFISTVYSKNKNVSSVMQKPFLFSVLYGVEGKVDQKIAEGKINTFIDKLQIQNN